MLFALHILCLCAMVLKRRLLKLSPPPLPLKRFSPGLFGFYKKYLMNLFLLMRLLPNIMDFQSKTNFFFQFIAGIFLILLFCVYVCHRALFHSLSS